MRTEDQRYPCPACQGAGCTQSTNPLESPEQSCPVCQGHGTISGPLVHSSIQQTENDVREAIQYHLPSMFGGETIPCLHCQGQGMVEDADDNESRCPFCHGYGLLTAQGLPLSETGKLAASHRQPNSAGWPHTTSPSVPDQAVLHPSHSNHAGLYTLDIGGLTPLDGMPLETSVHIAVPEPAAVHPPSIHYRVRHRVMVLTVSFGFFLAFTSISAYVLMHKQSQQSTLTRNSTASAPPPLAIIGGAETAFRAKFGPPQQRQQDSTTDGMLVETFSNQLSISVYLPNHSVYGLKEPAGTQGWTRDQALAGCQSYLPADARLGSIHQIGDQHGNAATAWIQFGQSTLLATLLPAGEFALSDPTTPPGSFTIEVFANPQQSNDFSACAIKLGDRPTDPGSILPSSLVPILAPTPLPHGLATPTVISFDVPTPTLGPTETPLPTSTMAPTFTPTVANTPTPTNTPKPTPTPHKHHPTPTP